LISYFDLLLFPIFLYAEIHYRFKYFISLLKTREPEIVTDVPHRLEPNRPLPILLYVKDAHVYPITLHRVQAEIRTGQSAKRYELLSEHQSINEKHWWRVFDADVGDLSGWVEVVVMIDIEANGKRKVVQIDNYRTSSHAPFQVYLSKEPLPRFTGLYFGDAHTHSSYTDDQVEFGAPLSAARQLSRAMGLSFFCTTDHSYDLDDRVDDYLQNDPSLPKWKALQDEVTQLNSEGVPFVIVRGEETTVRNRDGRNVHLLIYGNRRFIPGSGDGAERWFQTRSEHDIKEAIQLKEADALAVAAHVLEPVPLLQRLFLGRGNWSEQDLRHDGLCGLQFANGSWGTGFDRGYELWIKLLLQGRRIVAVAGNDAHGNFNRFRQIGLPFFSIRESNEQIFGRMRTGVFLQKIISEASILDGLRAGATIVTDGPVIHLRAINELKETASVGQEIQGKEWTLMIDVVSSVEFGSVESIRCYRGVVGESRESLIVNEHPPSGTRRWKVNVQLLPRGTSYVRAEVRTRSAESYDGHSHFCITNALWLSPA